MELIEREGFLNLLQEKFSSVEKGEGHCVFVKGEAGIGKTSLVKVFSAELRNEYKVLQGSCEALFTPRPLAPFYDIAPQIRSNFLFNNNENTEDRSGLFSRFFYELNNLKEACVIIFEDIHWADEATLDFIKFLARRITYLRCLFILTYRDNEISAQHPLRNVLGQLPPDSFTGLQLTPLSREAVTRMAEKKGYSGEDVYSVSGGNPFYVTEILSNYSLGVPDSIKDAILFVYNRTDERTKKIWELVSVIPVAFELKYLEKLEPLYASAIESSLELKILIIKDGLISFKHELFRRAIETSLSPLKRIELNKKIFYALSESFEQKGEMELLVHHAKNANEYDAVVHFAPLAARQAALVGAHTEASKLYFTAIEYYQGNDKVLLNQFYEAYAYECYLTNQTIEAIIYSTKSLEFWQQNENIEKTGDCLRFLSRLWWINDNLKNAEKFAIQSIEVLDHQPFIRAKALAYSNMSQLKMLADKAEECFYWGEKAITLAEELGDQAILAHAKGNVGGAQIRIPVLKNSGYDLLNQSLEIALENSFHEHAARAYTNMAYNGVIIKDYEFADKILTNGICYCEENNLDLWRIFLLTVKAKLSLDTGRWQPAYETADMLLKSGQPSRIIEIFALTIVATIKMRRGDKENILPLLIEAKNKAFEAMELQRIIQALASFLEYEWITGQRFVEKSDIDTTIKMIERIGNIYANSEFAYWLFKARGVRLSLREVYEGYDQETIAKSQKAAALWKKLGNTYAQALLLFDGTNEDKRSAISIVHSLGADAVYQKMKQGMRNSGIKSVPRGIRKSTQSNPALLTNREIDVLHLLKEGLQSKEIAGKLFISPKTVDHHISAILFKLEVNSRAKAVTEALRLEILN